MSKYIYIVVIAVFMAGCGDSEPKKQMQEIKEVDVSQIKVTQGKKSVDKETNRHTDELKKDKKGFYYAYSENNSSEDETYTRLDAQKRVKNRVVDGKVSVVQKKGSTKVENPYEYVRIDLLKSALSHDFMVKCSACHDDYANGVIGPSLLTKDSDYIYKKMMTYREDPKKNIFMYELVNKMSEKELKAMADEVAKFNKEVRVIKEGK
jgi:cytochrome c553